MNPLQECFNPGSQLDGILGVSSRREFGDDRNRLLNDRGNDHRHWSGGRLLRLLLLLLALAAAACEKQRSDETGCPLRLPCARPA